MRSDEALDTFILSILASLLSCCTVRRAWATLLALGVLDGILHTGQIEYLEVLLIGFFRAVVVDRGRIDDGLTKLADFSFSCSGAL